VFSRHFINENLNAIRSKGKAAEATMASLGFRTTGMKMEDGSPRYHECIVRPRKEIVSFRLVGVALVLRAKTGEK